jgi:hypothetical protein
MISHLVYRKANASGVGTTRVIFREHVREAPIATFVLYEQIQISRNHNRKTRPPCGGHIDGLGVEQGLGSGMMDALVNNPA